MKVFLGATLSWVPKKRPTEEETGQKPFRRFLLMTFWQFHCICRSSYVSWFLKVKRKHEYWRELIWTERPRGGICLDADLNPPPPHDKTGKSHLVNLTGKSNWILTRETGKHTTPKLGRWLPDWIQWASYADREIEGETSHDLELAFWTAAVFWKANVLSNPHCAPPSHVWTAY